MPKGRQYSEDEDVLSETKPSNMQIETPTDNYGTENLACSETPSEEKDKVSEYYQGEVVSSATESSNIQNETSSDNHVISLASSYSNISTLSTHPQSFNKRFLFQSNVK